jgi:hypothetical protein
VAELPSKIIEFCLELRQACYLCMYIASCTIALEHMEPTHFESKKMIKAFLNNNWLMSCTQPMNLDGKRQHEELIS